MRPTDEEDRAALARLASGDRSALSGLVVRHQDALFRFLRRLSADSASAEDALQETFVSVYRHASHFRGEGSVRGWMFAIARRQAAMGRRRHVGEPAHLESLETLGLEAGWGEDGRALLDRLADQQAVGRALERLSAEEQEILLLHDVEGLSGPETATALELSVPAMKSRLHRARLRLAGALEKGGRDGRGS